MTPGAQPTMPSMAGDMRRFAMLVGLPAVMLLSAGDAHATNRFCEEHRLELIPVYQTLIKRLEDHVYTRDNDLKIDLETDTRAFMKFRQQDDRTQSGWSMPSGTTMTTIPRRNTSVAGSSLRPSAKPT